MRIAALYDIHGNLPALEAVLRQVEQVVPDVVVIGGDVVPGPMPSECLSLLRGVPLPMRYIMGNGDREVLAARRGSVSAAIPEAFRDVIRWNADALSDDDAAFMSGWPKALRLDTGDPGGTILFCHATPDSDTPIFTRETPEDRLGPLFEAVDAGVIVCGHTHMQFDRMVGDRRVVNAGSVGMPFGDPGAYWLLLDGEPRLQFTSYDLTAASARILGTAYPQATAFADGNVLHPPAEARMLAAYAKVAVS